MSVKAHVSTWKKDEVKELVQLLQKYKVIGIADMTNMPSAQLQKMRQGMKGKTLIKMTKGRLLRIAIDLLKDKIPHIEKLKENVKGMPALLLSNENPFTLAKTLKKSKSSAPAKPGQASPNDIPLQAGPTPFTPGPIIGELGQMGIKTQIQDGKIHIKEDLIVVKEGQIISPQVASLLTKLGIEPMEIGINLLAAYENGTIFSKAVLFIDEKQYLVDIQTAAGDAFKLAFSIEYADKTVLTMLVQKAWRDSMAVAEAGKVETSEVFKKKVGQADQEMNAVADQLKGYEPQEQKVSQQPSMESKPINHTPQAAQLPKEKFKEEEKIAQDILKGLQDQKIKRAGSIL